jgi:hypothetical protein
MGYVRNPVRMRHRGRRWSKCWRSRGLNEKGNRSSIRIADRIGQEKADEIKGQADLVRPGDIIDVKRSIW